MLSNATAIIDVTDPQNPREVGSVPGNPSLWREVKVYQFFDAAAGAHRAYAYITTEAPGSGLQVRNSLFLGNLAAGSGGAGMLGGAGPKRVVGNTVAGNDSPGPLTDGFYVLGPGVLANNLMAQNGDRDLFLGPPGGHLLLHNNFQQGAGLEPDPASTGNSAASLTSVSASSAAGSESRTTPTPA